ncbi:helix-turn-helix domain-containing protein [Brevibacillus panacihumi]|uniref:helix-turn-helix domain-containing protein n=1 Tax=Brevibacillus panacihumi TaxID=497735 RepID=UPI003D19F0B2
MEYGAILKACRVRSKMTQEQLAKKLHIARSCVSKLESGKKLLDVPTLVKWAEATSSREVVVACLYGLDGLSIIQNVLGLMLTFWFL